MATLRKYTTRYGVIYRLIDGCKDDYESIETSKFYRKESGLIKWRRRSNPVTLQRPALKSFKMAEEKLGREIVVTGSMRTCELQAQLYASDPNRYAPPSVGVHCQGLAIDVTTEDPQLQTKVRDALKLCGWKQARPDEIWHFSFYVKA